MHLTEYKKMNGQTIVFPEGFRLTVKETSDCVYQITMFDDRMRSVSNSGTNLDHMVEKAIEDLMKQ
jgi:hypothetical protein